MFEVPKSSVLCSKLEDRWVELLRSGTYTISICPFNHNTQY